MSRSHRLPYSTICKKDKNDKKLHSRRRRAIEKQLLSYTLLLDELVFPTKQHHVSNLWDWRQDGGKYYWPWIEKLYFK